MRSSSIGGHTTNGRFRTSNSVCPFARGSQPEEAAVARTSTGFGQLLPTAHVERRSHRQFWHVLLPCNTWTPFLSLGAKEVRDDGSIVEIAIWQLPEALPPSRHTFKYRLYFGAAGVCRVRYDNECGKGDHRHIGAEEFDYVFTSVEQLLEDFRLDVERWEQL
jgi:hypothetical protein